MSWDSQRYLGYLGNVVDNVGGRDDEILFLVVSLSVVSVIAYFCWRHFGSCSPALFVNWNMLKLAETE